MRKIIVMLLVVLLAMPTFAGCGKKARTYDPNNFIADTNSKKIVKDKITLNFFVPKSTLHGKWEDMYLFKKMEEITNIHVEFEEVLLESYNEKRSFKWKDTKNPADAFFLANSMEEITISKNVLRELEPTMIDFAPNYMKMMKKHPLIDTVSRADDNKIYSFATINEIEGQSATQFINKSWIEWLVSSGHLKASDLGSDGLPTTIDQYYKTLKAFKEHDPNGKNGADELPLSYVSSDATKNFLMSAFGFVGTGIELDSATDKVVYVPQTNNYREYLKFANRLYTEGLIDPNVYGNKASDLATKGIAGKLGSFSSSASFLVVGAQNASQYTSLPPLTSAVNNSKMWYQFEYNYNPIAMIVPKETPYYREIVRWMDLFYSPEFEVLQSFGEEGNHWSWDNEAKTSWTFKVPEGMEREQYRASLTYQAGLGGNIMTTEFIKKDSDPLISTMYKEKAKYSDYLKTPMPQLRYTVPQMQRIADIEAQLTMHIVTAESNFIKASPGSKYDPNGAQWDEHVKTLKRIGSDELVKIYQDAYDAYKAKG